MKARVKATGEILEIFKWSKVDAENFKEYELSELEIIDPYSMDYWEKLKHQYAGMAMQGMLSNAVGFEEVRKQTCNSGDNLIDLIADAAVDYATALVKKLRENK